MTTVLLVGRPNAGKSSLYNAITGGNARVGNYPGVTVDILEGNVTLPAGGEALVADLPGLYSLTVNLDSDTDEGIAKKYVARVRDAGGPVCVVHVIDGEQLAVHLRLSRDVASLGLPTVLVVSHRDEMEAAGYSLDEAALADATGARAVWVSPRKDAAAAKSAVVAAIEEALGKNAETIHTFEPREVAARVLTRSAEAQAKLPGASLDRVLLHPLIGPVIFLGLMAAVFAGVFLVADPATSLMDALVDASRKALTRRLGDGPIVSFVSDGIIAGAGTVLVFMPQIVLLTVAMEVLEATGYLARGAFLLDRVLGVLGLSGRSFLPLLMGHACAVPAIGATRVIRDPRERLTAILVIPLMTCSARLPTYGLLLATFFATRGVWFKSLLMIVLYALGVLGGLAASLVLRRTVLSGRSLPMVIEMPRYRRPQLRNVWLRAKSTTLRFGRDVGTTIVGVSAVLWILLSVPVTSGATPIDRSLAAAMGRAFEPVTKLAGFDWRINVGLIGSFGAREVMVSTMGVIFGMEKVGDDSSGLAARIASARTPSGAPLYGIPNGLALLFFFVIACQCMSTVAAIRRETRSWRWPLFVLAYTYGAAFIGAVLVFQIASRL